MAEEDKKRTVFGVGFVGEGIYRSRKPNRGDKTKIYLTWFAMMQRCYSENSLKSKPTYFGAEVCSEWHNFQNFGKWFDENYYEIPNCTMCLDKDIINFGNKIYSPENCVFVPQQINKLLTLRQNGRGNLPLGVSLLPNGRYKASCSFDSKTISAGTFENLEDAISSYFTAKENVIKIMAERYKDYIPHNLYKKMLDYNLSIYYSN
jgi:hypothetical protein